MSKRVAVLTSGGDCPGLNAALRSLVLAGHQRGWTMLGIERGFRGLLADPPAVRGLTAADVPAARMAEGGTFLGATSDLDPFAVPEAGGRVDRGDQLAAALAQIAAEAVIVIGGDGTLRMAHKLALRTPVPVIGLPKTIDNDVTGSERTIGFASAVAVAAEAVARLATTAASHDRLLVLETMGRTVGHLALAAATAGAADAVLIPELPLQNPEDWSALAQRLSHASSAVVVVAEGAARGVAVAETLERLTSRTARATVLGHLQRGGPAVPEDRLLAAAFATAAIAAVAAGGDDTAILWQGGRPVPVPLAAIAAAARPVEPAGLEVAMARAAGVWLPAG
ncbi:MAG: ATP-dependent 6-phosphofructokinase [Alphaproteobacteria bacterium]|nr:ATP-dependent 6-phosphofructokinase [Alphaproteobacteria bacterium]